MHRNMISTRCGIVGAALLLTAAEQPELVRVRDVTDGDTVRLTFGERIRIAGIDAPGTHADQARCAREIALGDAAVARARTLLDGQSVGIDRVGRSYDRTVARVTLDGRDLATLLVANRVARWWPADAPKPNWCGDATDRREGQNRRGAPRADRR